jgi:hypothetical protein
MGLLGRRLFNLIDCRDLANDPGNCGGCGHECPDNLVCEEGVCMGDEGDPTPDNCGESVR